MSTLDQLANKYGTDKGPPTAEKYGHHYTKQYAQYFESMRRKKLTILELGWGGHEDPDQGGSSAQMWREYFPNATVVCIDIEPKEITRAHDGIHFRQGSQSDPEFIRSLVDEFGSFDIVIDDASHLSSLTIKSWELLYPHLKRGGMYAVEDTHMSYHQDYYGKSEANLNPTKRTSTGATTCNQYFQRMTDEVNYRGRYDNDLDLFPKKYWLGYELEWVHFYFNLIVVKKRD